MKSSRFSQEQIIGILKPGEAGAKVSDLCRQKIINPNLKCIRTIGKMDMPACSAFAP